MYERSLKLTSGSVGGRESMHENNSEGGKVLDPKFQQAIINLFGKRDAWTCVLLYKASINSTCTTRYTGQLVVTSALDSKHQQSVATACIHSSHGVSTVPSKTCVQLRSGRAPFIGLTYNSVQMQSGCLP
jgi:hypothetical protein